MANAPIVSWYEGTNATANEVVSTINYGVVDSDTASPTKVFYIWNNRGQTEDAPKMEAVTFTTRDRTGGLGDGTGSSPVVEAVRDNWFRVRVDSLGESAFIQVGKGGGNNPDPEGRKALGTNGTTKNIHASTATAWTASTPLIKGAYIKPTVANGYIYRVETAGTTGGTQPTWSTQAGNTQTDGTVEYITIKIDVTPNSQEILGLANNTNASGSNATDAGGNFTQISVFAEVPVSASSGRNLLVSRVSYKFT